MSFTSEPGRDDGNPPPVNIVIPDDARELERDVLAYHREQRARRRRQRLVRLLGPLRSKESGGQAAILPLAATCVALSMLAAAMLSVVAISPASAPTLTEPPTVSAGPVVRPVALTSLPTGTVQLDGHGEQVRSLTSSALALVPAVCDCGPALSRLAGQAAQAHVALYFVGAGAAIPQLAGLIAQYGGGTAKAVYDTGDVLAAAYHPDGLTVLLVYSNATADVRRNLPPDFQFTPVLRQLTKPGKQLAR